jgi:hypothetical protein
LVHDVSVQVGNLHGTDEDTVEGKMAVKKEGWKEGKLGNLS